MEGFLVVFNSAAVTRELVPLTELARHQLNQKGRRKSLLPATLQGSDHRWNKRQDKSIYIRELRGRHGAGKLRDFFSVSFVCLV